MDVESESPRARVSMAMAASPESIYRAFVEPDWLSRFWLTSASGPLAIGATVDWQFMVSGATDRTTATRLKPGVAISWRWSDGGEVDIDLEQIDGATAVTVINSGFPGEPHEQNEAALNATEGFAIVLCDLKTLMEQGHSAGLVSAKAKLIELRDGKTGSDPAQ